MKSFFKLIGTLVGLAVIAVLIIIALVPWMDRWGATKDEIAASFPGDELVPEPRVAYSRAVTVNATPEEIYPWLVQMGAEKGGMYSYSWFETNLLRCELINADSIHEEWQGLKVGDKVKMCPGTWGPPAYEVALLEPNQALVLGHQESGQWSDVWQFILVPQTDGTTRLIARGRDMKSGGIWDLIRPGQFIMERGMLLGIKQRAEQQHLAETQGIPSTQEITPTPEVFIPLDKAIPDYGITLEGVHLDIVNATLSETFPAGCIGQAPGCIHAQNGDNLLSVKFEPRDLPEGQMLDYKNLPDVQVAMEGGSLSPCSQRKYDNDTHLLTLGFEVPQSAAVFGLKWADLVEIPLNIDQSASRLQTVSLSEFGRDISLSYNSGLASKVETATVPAVPFTDQILFAEAHPEYAQIRFPGFLNGRLYELPLLPLENRDAQVMIFRTADFPGYGDDNPFGFVGQREALTGLLKTGVDPDSCAKPLTSDLSLPFLPWINAKQSFCAQPQLIQFSGGQGVRYLSYYTQGLNPVLDKQVFYTFQGLTNDGQFYISALFPVQTGIFPTEPSPCSVCGDTNYDPSSEFMTLLSTQLTDLNAQAGDHFVPSLAVLDKLVQSIQIGQ